MKKGNYILKEKLFKYFLFGNTLIIALLFGIILYSLISESKISLEKFSFRFFYDDIWQPLISSDNRVNKKDVFLKTLATTDNKTSCYLSILPENSSDNRYKNLEFNIYTDYKLKDFSSTNISRNSDVMLDRVIIKDSLGNITDVTDFFKLKWDYLSKHSDNFFNINLIATDSIFALDKNSKLLAILEFDGVDIHSSTFKNSWSFKAHNLELDGYKSDKINTLNLSSFDYLVNDSIDNEEKISKIIFNKIDSISTANLSISLSHFDNNGGNFEDKEHIFGNSEPSEKYGALPYIIGTILTSFIALLLAIPFSLAIAIFLGEYFRNYKIAIILKSLIDLISAIPSVIYGFWGLVVLVPIVASFGAKFGINTSGISIISASIILAFMIIPYMATIGAEVIKMVPTELKEAAYGLGATRFDVIRKVVLPYTKSGLISGMILSLGRALGETMAVTMLIGNVTGKIVTNLFEPSNSMASIIANNFAEAGFTLFSSLIEIALILFILTAIISFIGRYYIRKGVING